MDLNVAQNGRERWVSAEADAPAQMFPTKRKRRTDGQASLVTEQGHGRERRYRLVPAQLRPVRDWMAYHERFWDEHLDRLEKRLTKCDD
jgi:hypothetical protein